MLKERGNRSANYDNVRERQRQTDSQTDRQTYRGKQTRRDLTGMYTYSASWNTQASSIYLSIYYIFIKR